MNKKVILLYIGLMFILSGCSFNYTIKINKDKTIDEKITVQQINEVINIYYDGNFNNYYSSKLDELEKTYENYNYESKIEEKKGNVLINASKKYNNYNEYFTSKHLSRYFKNITVTETKKGLSVFFDGYTDPINIDADDPYYYVEPFDIIIKSDYKLVDHNADNSSDKQGTYIWKFDQYSEDKTIEFTISDNVDVWGFLLNNFFALIVLVVAGVIVLIVSIIYLKINGEIKRVNKI